MSVVRKIIYIRHGEDTRENYKYDEVLTHKGKHDVKELTKELVEEHGVPDIIYYSPYYRTRQTKRIMVKTIHELYSTETKTICDDRLSRFFTKKQSQNPDIRRETLKRGAPIYESFKEFKERVSEQLEEVEKEHNEEIIWCVTHTLILDHIIQLKEIDHDYHIPYLDTIVLTV